MERFCSDATPAKGTNFPRPHTTDPTLTSSSYYTAEMREKHRHYQKPQQLQREEERRKKEKYSPSSHIQQQHSIACLTPPPPLSSAPPLTPLHSMTEERVVARKHFPSYVVRQLPSPSAIYEAKTAVERQGTPCSPEAAFLFELRNEQQQKVRQRRHGSIRDQHRGGNTASAQLVEVTEKEIIRQELRQKGLLPPSASMYRDSALRRMVASSSSFQQQQLGNDTNSNAGNRDHGTAKTTSMLRRKGVKKSGGSVNRERNETVTGRGETSVKNDEMVIPEARADSMCPVDNVIRRAWRKRVQRAELDALKEAEEQAKRRRTAGSRSQSRRRSPVQVLEASLPATTSKPLSRSTATPPSLQPTTDGGSLQQQKQKEGLKGFPPSTSSALNSAAICEDPSIENTPLALPKKKKKKETPLLLNSDDEFELSGREGAESNDAILSSPLGQSPIRSSEEEESYNEDEGEEADERSRTMPPLSYNSSDAGSSGEDDFKASPVLSLKQKKRMLSWSKKARNQLPTRQDEQRRKQEEEEEKRLTLSAVLAGRPDKDSISVEEKKSIERKIRATQRSNLFGNAPISLLPPQDDVAAIIPRRLSPYYSFSSGRGEGAAHGNGMGYNDADDEIRYGASGGGTSMLNSRESGTGERMDYTFVRPPATSKYLHLIRSQRHRSGAGASNQQEAEGLLLPHMSEGVTSYTNESPENYAIETNENSPAAIHSNSSDIPMLGVTGTFGEDLQEATWASLDISLGSTLSRELGGTQNNVKTTLSPQGQGLGDTLRVPRHVRFPVDAAEVRSVEHSPASTGDNYSQHFMIPDADGGMERRDQVPFTTNRHSSLDGNTKSTLPALLHGASSASPSTSLRKDGTDESSSLSAFVLPETFVKFNTGTSILPLKRGSTLISPTRKGTMMARHRLGLSKDFHASSSNNRRDSSFLDLHPTATISPTSCLQRHHTIKDELQMIVSPSLSLSGKGSIRRRSSTLMEHPSHRHWGSGTPHLAHQRYNLEVVLRPGVTEVTEEEVERLIAPFEKYVLGIEFGERGGNFVSLICEVPLQGLKALHAMLTRIRHGLSTEIQEAFVAPKHYVEGACLMEAPRLSTMMPCLEEECEGEGEDPPEWFMKMYGKVLVQAAVAFPDPSDTTRRKKKKRRGTGEDSDDEEESEEDDEFYADGDSPKSKKKNLKEKRADFAARMAAATAERDRLQQEREKNRREEEEAEKEKERDDQRKKPEGDMSSAFSLSSGIDPQEAPIQKDEDHLTYSALGTGEDFGDLTSNEEKRFMDFIESLSQPSSTGGPRSLDHLALIVSVTEFFDEAIAPLPQAGMDAAELYDRLKDLNFEIVLMTTDSDEPFLVPTAFNIRRMVKALLSLVPSKTSVFFVFMFSRGFTGTLEDLEDQWEVVLATDSKIYDLNPDLCILPGHIARLEDDYGRHPCLFVDTWPIPWIPQASSNPSNAFFWFTTHPFDDGGNELFCNYHGHAGGIATYYLKRALQGHALATNTLQLSVNALIWYLQTKLAVRGCQTEHNAVIARPYSCFFPLVTYCTAASEPELKENLARGLIAEQSRSARINMKILTKIGVDSKMPTFSNYTSGFLKAMMDCLHKALYPAKSSKRIFNPKFRAQKRAKLHEDKLRLTWFRESTSMLYVEYTNCHELLTPAKQLGKLQLTPLVPNLQPGDSVTWNAKRSGVMRDFRTLSSKAQQYSANEDPRLLNNDPPKIETWFANGLVELRFVSSLPKYQKKFADKYLIASTWLTTPPGEEPVALSRRFSRMLSVIELSFDGSQRDFRKLQRLCRTQHFASLFIVESLETDPFDVEDHLLATRIQSLVRRFIVRKTLLSQREIIDHESDMRRYRITAWEKEITVIADALFKDRWECFHEWERRHRVEMHIEYREEKLYFQGIKAKLIQKHEVAAREAIELLEERSWVPLFESTTRLRIEASYFSLHKVNYAIQWFLTGVLWDRYYVALDTYQGFLRLRLDFKDEHKGEDCRIGQVMPAPRPPTTDFRNAHTCIHRIKKEAVQNSALRNFSLADSSFPSGTQASIGSPTTGSPTRRTDD